MRDSRSVAAKGGYLVTDAGRAVLVDDELCACQPVRIGRQVVCESCDTVYGVIAFDDHRYAYFERKPD